MEFNGRSIFKYIVGDVAYYSVECGSFTLTSLLDFLSENEIDTGYVSISSEWQEDTSYVCVEWEESHVD